MGWSLFLPDNYIHRVENKAHEIAEALAETRAEGEGLMGGAAGLACFYAYYADYSRNPSYKELSMNMMERSINPPDGHRGRYSLSDGLAGICWTIDHLIKNKLYDFDAADIFTNVDSLLYEGMMLEIREGHYDYLHGALGIALYFLRDAENEEYRSNLGEVVRELRHLAITDTDGSIKWNSVLDGDTGLQGVNLSLSHGMASIIIILSKIMEAGIEESHCADMILGGLRYIEKQKFNPEEYLSSFPSWGVENMEELKSSRLAWCYGDLGIALACIKASQQMKNTTYQLDGVDLLMRSSRRKDLIENSVHDAGICHGASGSALIYNIMYQQTGRKSLSEASLYWLDVCLNMAYHEDGLAGYKAWYHPEYGGWKTNAGLLEGVAGIGLMLLSFVSLREANWAKSLLIN